jgi:hypothetical protein
MAFPGRPSAGRIAHLCGFGWFADRIENPRSRRTDVFETFHQKSRITLVKLNVILAGVSGFESDGVADHEGNSFGFGFSLAL